MTILKMFHSNQIQAYQEMHKYENDGVAGLYFLGTQRKGN